MSLMLKVRRQFLAEGKGGYSKQERDYPRHRHSLSKGPKKSRDLCL
jgi:hypothetical protein